MDEHPYTISDLAQEFDISARTIRYYEEVGLLSPIRTPGGIRRYSRRDRARLKLILRGKRFGFSLEEIREMLDLFDADRTGRKQLQRALAYGERQIRAIDEKIADLTALKEEMLALKAEFERRLRELDATPREAGATSEGDSSLAARREAFRDAKGEGDVTR